MEECCVDCSFSAAKGGGVGETKRGKGCKVIMIAERTGLDQWSPRRERFAPRPRKQAKHSTPISAQPKIIDHS